MRDETRLERYQDKARQAIDLPLSIAAINFMFDDNLAFLIRAAACFGVRNLYVIGAIPPRKILQPKSGSLCDFVNLVSFRNPSEFLSFVRKNSLNLISAELDDEAHNLHEFSFDFGKNNCIILGHEMSGIPVELMMNSVKVYIPMPGSGFCLNTAQAGTVFIHEFARQFLTRGK